MSREVHNPFSLHASQVVSSEHAGSHPLSALSAPPLSRPSSSLAVLGGGSAPLLPAASGPPLLSSSSMRSILPPSSSSSQLGIRPPATKQLSDYVNDFLTNGYTLATFGSEIASGGSKPPRQPAPVAPFSHLRFYMAAAAPPPFRLSGGASSANSSAPDSTNSGPSTSSASSASVTASVQPEILARIIFSQRYALLASASDGGGRGGGDAALPDSSSISAVAGSLPPSSSSSDSSTSPEEAAAVSPQASLAQISRALAWARARLEYLRVQGRWQAAAATAHAITALLLEALNNARATAAAAGSSSAPSRGASLLVVPLAISLHWWCLHLCDSLVALGQLADASALAGSLLYALRGDETDGSRGDGGAYNSSSGSSKNETESKGGKVAVADDDFLSAAPADLSTPQRASITLKLAFSAKQGGLLAFEAAATKEATLWPPSYSRSTVALLLIATGERWARSLLQAGLYLAASKAYSTCQEMLSRVRVTATAHLHRASIQRAYEIVGDLYAPLPSLHRGVLWCLPSFSLARFSLLRGDAASFDRCLKALVSHLDYQGLANASSSSSSGTTAGGSSSSAWMQALSAASATGLPPEALESPTMVERLGLMTVPTPSSTGGVSSSSSAAGPDMATVDSFETEDESSPTSASASNIYACLAHIILGQRHLMEGKLDGACKAFEAALDASLEMACPVIAKALTVIASSDAAAWTELGGGRALATSATAPTIAGASFDCCPYSSFALPSSVDLVKTSASLLIAAQARMGQGASGSLPLVESLIRTCPQAFASREFVATLAKLYDSHYDALTGARNKKVLYAVTQAYGFRYEATIYRLHPSALQ